MSFGKGAGGDAASAQAAANLQGIEEIRKQFDIAQTNVDPFIQAGQGALPDVQEGATIEGLGERLNRIFSGEAFGGLIEQRERAGTNLAAAGGNLRSGKGILDAANIPTELGLMLEQILSGRSQQLAGQGLQGGLELGSLGQQAGANVANLFSQTGTARSSGIITDAQAKSAAIGQGLEVAGTVVPIIASFFSDPALKENVEEIGEVGGIKAYQWDWIPAAKDTIIGIQPTLGFMADEVAKVYPQFVAKWNGYQIIHYPGLLAHLESTENATLRKLKKERKVKAEEAGEEYEPLALSI